MSFILYYQTVSVLLPNGNEEQRTVVCDRHGDNIGGDEYWRTIFHNAVGLIF